MRKRGGRKRSQPRGHCIFCGGFGLTKQHVWPDWFRHVFERGNSHQIIESVGVTDAVRQVVRRQGAVFSTKERRVCESCNGGWIRDVEDRARPIAMRLMRDDDWVLTRADLDALAAWIPLLPIMAEYGVPKPSPVPESELRTYRQLNAPSQAWTVCIGRCLPSADGADWQHRNAGAIGVSVAGAEARTEEVQFHTVTMRFGRLVVHTFFASHAVVVETFRTRWIPRLVLPILPPNPRFPPPTRWHDLPLIDHAAFGDIQRSTVRHIESAIPPSVGLS